MNSQIGIESQLIAFLQNDRSLQQNLCKDISTMALWTTLLFVIAICILSFADNSLTQTVKSPVFEDINGLQKVVAGSIESIRPNDDSVRNQRSPSYNDDEEDYFGDYSDGPDARHLKHGHKKKKLHKPLLLELLGGQGGCRGNGCGGSQGWQPQSGGHNQGSHGSQGGSFASASAGSVGGSPHHGGGQSQANAQSASFSFGPYSATFSVAQASSGNNNNDGIRDYYDY